MGTLIDAALRFRRHTHERTESGGEGGGTGPLPSPGEVVELGPRRMDFEDLAEHDRTSRREYLLAVRAIRRAAKKYPLLFASDRFETLCILRWGAHPEESMEQAIERVRAGFAS